jgi:hypothetical protein
MIETYPIKRRDWFLLIIVLFVAGLMRFGQADVVEYFHDDGMLATLAQEIINGEQWHWTGIISSVGIPNPPMSIYVLLPAFAINTDPFFVILAIMAWNTVGVGILWWIAQRYFGRTTALIASVAYALSPWAIFYSRKLWAQDYHTPFILLAIALGLYGFAEQQHSRWQKWAQIAVMPVLLIGMQIHFAAWFLLPVYLVLLYMGRSNWQWRTLFVSGIFSLLVLLPYGVGLANTLQSDPTRIGDAIGRSEATETLVVQGDALTYWAYLTTGLGVETWVTPDDSHAMLEQVPPFNLWWLMLILVINGIIVVLLRPPYRRFFGLLMAWGFLPFVVFLLNWTPTYPHYFVASIPAMMLLVGIGTGWVARIVPLQPNGRVIILTAFAVIVVSQGWWWRGAVRYLEQTHIDYPGFTTPLSYLLPIRDALSDVDDVVVVAQGMAWDRHHEAVIWDTLIYQPETCVRTLQSDGYAVQPDGAFAVLVAPNASQDAVRGYYTQGAPDIVFPERQGGGDYRLYRFEQAPTWQDNFVALDTVGQFANGVQLLGYHYEQDLLTLRWRLPDGIRGENYQYSAQFFSEDGQRLAQADRVFWQGQHWCEGDVLLTWVNLPIEQTAETLFVSLYTLGTGAQTGQFFNVDVLDITGNTLGQAVEIPLSSSQAD